MQNTSKLLTSLSDKGISVSLADGWLKVVPKKLLTNEIREEVKSQRQQLITFLLSAGQLGTIETIAQVVSEVAPQEKDDLRGNDPEGIQINDAPGQVVEKIIPWRKPSLVAMDWLNTHRNQLCACGWTSRELYRRNKSIGLMWMKIWEQPSLGITIQNNGVTLFQFQTETGQPITQTARPIKQKPRR